MQLYHDALLIRQLLGNQPREDRLSLIVEKPLAGAFADHWPRLDNNSVLPRLSVEVPLSEEKSAWVLQSSIHNEASNSGRALTLGQLGRNTRLLYSTRLYGTVTASLYTYDRNSDVVRAFCEAWCPSTNTHHTMANELSISLWDLWSFGGLPIKGDFYEERIPSFKELTSTSRDKTKCLPTTCQYLFQAYYSIVCTQRNDRSASSKNDSQVTIGSWISFWYLGSRSYDKPTTRKQKKTSRSKSTQNPDGSKIQAREWSSRESMLFAELGIKDDLKDETYLAAFLSCWLCLFVFPQKGSFFVLEFDNQILQSDRTHGLSLSHALRPWLDLPNDIGGMPPAIKLDNILYHWRICTRRNTLSELYLPARSLEPCKHVTQRFTDWWTTKHGTYFEDNRHHLAMTSNLEEEVKEHKDESDSSKRYQSPLNNHLEGLIEPDSDESLTGPHAVDSAFEEVGTSKTLVNKLAEQSLRPSTLLEEIRRGKMTVGGKDLESPSSKEGICPKASLQKVSSAHAPLSELPLSASNKQTTRNPEPSQWIGEKVVSNLFQKTALSEAIDQQELEVAKLQDEVNTLESTHAITEEAIEALATVRQSMEAAREEFKNFKWRL
ncbi:hypothetical protein E6C27_scaffold110G002340 [Cucumis melo var. makuwa]|uniref:Aminotransferase-like plant mobile domain-containing protein n=1 Tax=Cucumis melo var. makuwa TaxID=1194695 RepID=A0A5A7TIV2_CUCMM|nr:hypothetical protein E6C27_scaffold110G002340 [Cucumis melo var. makuwa]